MNDSAIFILGPPRSGTTLLRLLLNAHSKICAPDECIFFSDAVFPRGPSNWRTNEVPPLVLERFTAHLASRLPQLAQSEIRAAINNAADTCPKAVFQAVMQLVAQKDGKGRWAEKTPGNLFFADVLHEMFPDGRFLFLQRDPRAIVASMNRVYFYSNDTALNAMNLRHYLSGMREAERTIPAEAQYHLRYEELLERPDETLHEVCEFLGIDYEPSMLDFHETAATSMDARAMSDFNRKATCPLDVANANHWRADLTDSDLALVERLLAHDLLAWNYPPISATTFRWQAHIPALLKSVYWRINRIRKRRERAFQQRDAPMHRTRCRIDRIRRRFGMHRVRDDLPGAVVDQ